MVLRTVTQRERQFVTGSSFSTKITSSGLNALRGVCVQSRQSLQLCKPTDYIPEAPLSMGFSRQEYWSGLPRWSPGNLSNPGIKPKCLTSPALTGGFFITSAAWEANPGETDLQRECTQRLGKELKGETDLQRERTQRLGKELK